MSMKSFQSMLIVIYTIYFMKMEKTTFKYISIAHIETHTHTNTHTKDSQNHNE